MSATRTPAPASAIAAALDLADALTDALRASIDIDVNPALDGVEVTVGNNTVTVVGTERRLCQVVSVPAETTGMATLVLPASDARAWVKALRGQSKDAQVVFGADGARLVLGELELVAEGIQGTFPSWRDLLNLPGQATLQIRMTADAAHLLATSSAGTDAIWEITMTGPTTPIVATTSRDSSRGPVRWVALLAQPATK